MMTSVYTVEIRNSSGSLVTILENAHDISYSQLINAPHVLRFSLPATDDKVANLILANELWLRDNRNDTVIRKFRLQHQTDTRQ